MAVWGSWLVGVWLEIFDDSTAWNRLLGPPRILINDLPDLVLLCTYTMDENPSKRPRHRIERISSIGFSWDVVPPNGAAEEGAPTNAALNAAILSAQHQQSESRLPLMLQMLQWAQDELALRHAVTFPRIDDLAEAVPRLPPPASSDGS